MASRDLSWLSILSTILCIVLSKTGARGFLTDVTYSNYCLDPPTCQGCVDIFDGGVNLDSYREFKCESVGVTIFPVIHDNSRSPFDRHIEFSHNRITFIPGNAFPVHISGGAKMDINLSSNLISDIDDSAFQPIPYAVNSIDLSNNQLSTIPSAIGTLDRLSFLNLAGNPMKSIDTVVMAGIRSSLNVLEISFGHLISWPSALDQLSNLRSLTINDLNMELKDPLIFRGFSNNLNTLRLLYTQSDHGPTFHIIPDAVVELTHLNTLDIHGEVYCTCNLTYLKSWLPPVFVQQSGFEHITCKGSSENVENYILSTVKSIC